MSFGFGFGFPKSAQTPGGATLNLQFAGATSLDPRITFTRASSGTYFDSTGTLQTATTDTPRLTYNPSALAPLGLLIEEQRTNSIRNNTMQGAVAGTPGTTPTNWFSETPSNGLARQIVGTGTENGISYIDVRYSGTTSASGLTAVYPETATQIAALSGQTWTCSFYVSLVGGSTANTIFTVVGIDEINSSGTFLDGSSTSFTLTSGELSGKRYAHTRVLNNGLTAFVLPYVFFTYNSGVAIDITLRIGLPQLEQGAFATSVIPTTTAAATRAADNASMTGTNFSSWYNASEGTVYFEGSTTNDAEAPFFTLQNAGVTDLIRSSRGFTQNRLLVNVASVTQVDLFSGTSITLGATAKTASAYKVNDFASVLNAGTVQTDTSGTVPTVSTLILGSGGFLGFLGGCISRITYYPRRLSNTELQAITS